MRDPHQRVVDRVRQRVERHAVGAGEHEVRDHPGLERDLAADEVREGDVAVRHPQPEHRPPALGPERGLLLLGQVAVRVVVAQLRVAPGRPVPRLDLLGRGVRLVHLARLHQQPEGVAVGVAALALPVRAVRAADLRSLVPLQAEPVQRVENCRVGLDTVALGVGVLDAEDEGAAGVTGVRPVEQRRPDQADVRGAGGRGQKRTRTELAAVTPERNEAVHRAGA